MRWPLLFPHLPEPQCQFLFGSYRPGATQGRAFWKRHSDTTQTTELLFMAQRILTLPRSTESPGPSTSSHPNHPLLQPPGSGRGCRSTQRLESHEQACPLLLPLCGCLAGAQPHLQLRFFLPDAQAAGLREEWSLLHSDFLVQGNPHALAMSSLTCSRQNFGVSTPFFLHPSPTQNSRCSPLTARSHPSGAVTGRHQTGKARELGPIPQPSLA